MINKNYLKAIEQIIRTGHWITDQVSMELKEYEISEPQYNVLRILRGRKGKPITVHEIQDQMVQRTSNVTRIVDKLLDKELVNRQECPTNRRKMDITITDKGQSFLVQLDKRVHDFHLPMAENLSEKEAITLTKLIIKLKGE
ncbi:MarR family transcriptional regulator [Fulvivirgaceae bacterium BMA10]|uniref:MarR family transcriptional regulator n=1 Tax=Splendidivirga corallicola TaxID=3051826 RepID=A0ABT8KVC7_9BACT|nr:MarR family transcriptional regulator [Fulvivirgaceae bacterium BMA10]